jgi:hypothetical protein
MTTEDEVLVEDRIFVGVAATAEIWLAFLLLNY